MMSFAAGFPVRPALLKQGGKVFWRSVFTLGVLLFAVNPAGSQPSVTESQDYRAKAVFLGKFPSLVEWPSQAFANSGSPLLICVFGDFRFGTSLAETLRGTSVQGHPLEARWVRKEQNLSACQVVYISGVEKSRYQRILKNLAGNSILTVGETSEFLDAGGVLYLYLEKERVRFDLNIGGALRARLKISSDALRLARRIVPRQLPASDHRP